MQRAFNSVFLSTLPLATLGCLIPLSVQAQITPDGTTSTTVNQDGNNFTINQGDRVGDNLFHSFNEFSVPTNGSAAFNNAESIANIFSRVTGGNISDIDGLISAKGAANLFLINPNGIIFGKNARLDLGGSFFASTADSLLFEGDTEFSASNPQAPPLLEVSIPIGANFRNNPEDIINRGNLTVEQDFTLSGGNLDLQGQLQAGGDLTLQATDSILLGSSASINSFSDANRGGDINVTAVEDIILDSSASISAFSDGNQGGDIKLTSGNEIRLGTFAGILTSNGGEIQLQANLMSIGNIAQVGSPVNNINDGGDIKFDISEKITIDGGNIGTLAGNFEPADEIQELGDSGNIIIETQELEVIGFATPVGELVPGGFLTGGDITSDVSGNSNAGNIEITASKVKLSNGSQIRASTLGTGDTGNITIKASDSVEVTGIILESNDPSEIATTVNSGASGNGKDLLIETNRLIVSDGGQIQAGAFGTGQGGNINVNATQSVAISDAIADENPTGLFTGPEGEGGTGKGGSINIKTPNLSILGEDSQISNEVDVAASGDAGNTFIEVERLIVGDGARVSNGTLSTGQGGTLEINASESVDLFGTGGREDGEEPGGLFTATFGFAEAGSLTLNTGRLNIRGGASITASTLGFSEIGKSGSITINASESIKVIGNSLSGRLSSRIASEAGRLFNFSNSSSLAAGGNIEIYTKQLTLEDTAEISTQTLGSGNSGNLSINASEFVQLIDGDFRTRTRGSGNAGDINITTGQLSILGDAEVTASTVGGSGRGGDLFVTASDSVQLSEGGLGSVSILGGDSGNITIQTQQLLVRDGASISNGLVGLGRVGNLEIIASDSLQVTGGTFIAGSDANDLIDDVIDTDAFDPNEELFFASRITTESGSLPENPAGNLSIQTKQLIVSDGAEITTRTVGDNPGGTLDIQASDFVEISGFATDDDFSNVSAQTTNDGDAGDIRIETPKLIVRDSAQISADTSGAGKAGTLTILADDSVQLTREGGLLVQAIEGSTAGNLNLETRELTITDGGFMNVSSLQGQAGNLNITVDSIFQNKGQITAETGLSEGDIGANINLKISDTWRIENESLVSATAFGDADGGNININQGLSDTEFLLFAFPPTGDRGSDIIANANQGDGGKIDITAAGVFGIDFRDMQTPLNDFTVTSEFGQSGETIINRTVDDPTTGLIDLPTSVGDVSDQISQNPCEQGVGSEFIVTGKGGLPPTVNESLNSEEARVSLIEAVPSRRQGDKETGRQGEKAQQTENLSTEAVPAMGWVFNERGEVTLTAYSTSDTKIHRSGQQHRPTCSSRIAP